MTDRLAEIKANHDRDIRTHDAIGIKLPRQCKEIAWLIAEVERLRPDAERWQYVRKFPDVLSGDQDSEIYHERYLTGDAADAAVDAARKAT